MAIFQAARARPASLPARQARISGLGVRATSRTFVRPRLIAEATAAVPRIRPATALLIAVLAAAAIGFAYLTQTLTSTATAVEIARLKAEQVTLERVIRSRETLIVSKASEAQVRDEAAGSDFTELRTTRSSGKR